MSLPKRALYTLSEAAARWGCQPADIAEWAIAGHLELVIVIPPTQFEGEVLSDVVVIAPGDILTMFPRWGTTTREGTIYRARALGGTGWLHVQPPEAGVTVCEDNLMLRAETVARFEEEHGVFRRAAVAPTRGHDWDGFYAAVIQRVFRNGLPERQADLVGEMQDWFIASNPQGDAPDESTIRKRISPIWRLLQREA